MIRRLRNNFLTDSSRPKFIYCDGNVTCEVQPTNRLPEKALRNLMNIPMVVETMRDVAKSIDVTNLLVIFIREVWGRVTLDDSQKPMYDNVIFPVCVFEVIMNSFESNSIVQSIHEF